MFTEFERETLATPLSIRLERASRRADRGALGTLVDLMNEESTLIYDSYNPWVGMLQTFIMKRAGTRAHREAVLWASEYAIRPFARAFGELSVKARVQRICRRLKATGSTFDVEEDASRVRVHLDPWGPARQWRTPHPWQEEQPRKRRGDRWVHRNFGAYDQLYQSGCDGYEHPDVLEYVPGPDPLTHQRPRVPCFAVPEILLYEIYPIEEFGAPLAVIHLPSEPGESTILDVHKDPAETPPEAYERVGMTKPRRVDLPAAGGTLFGPKELWALSTPLSIQVEEAASGGDWDGIEEVAGEYDRKLVSGKDPLSILTAGLLSWIARHRGEDAVEEAHRWSADVAMGPFVEVVDSMSAREQAELWATVWRAHGSTFWMEEDVDRIRFRGNPLGACHRMWIDESRRDTERVSEDRVRYPTFDCYSPPSSFHRMREPRGITYGKTGYPVYSTQCHLTHEVYTIDRLGYPLWIEEHPVENPRDETVHLLYKDPGEWPARYYERVGRSPPG